MPPLRPSTMWRLSSCGVDSMSAAPGRPKPLTRPRSHEAAPSEPWGQRAKRGAIGQIHAGNVAARDFTHASPAVALLELDSAAARARVVAARLRLDAARRWLGRMVDPIQAQGLRRQAGGVDLRVAFGRAERCAARFLQREDAAHRAVVARTVWLLGRGLDPIEREVARGV